MFLEKASRVFFNNGVQLFVCFCERVERVRGQLWITVGLCV